MATAIATLSERRPGCNGITSRASAAACTSSGTPADFAAEQQDVAVREPVIEIGDRRLGREHHQPQPFLSTPLLKIVPAFVPDDADLVEIVHSGAAEGAVGDRKARRFHDMRLQAEAGA